MIISATILIVEDEAIVAADLENKLRLLGYRAIGIIAKGEEAVSAACSLYPDLVLMDIRLKGRMDGIEAAEQIRRKCNLPVIYLTAHSDTATLERAKLTEPYGYILKPFEERELQTNIEMALYRHKIERQLRESEERFQFATKAMNGLVRDWDMITNTVLRAEMLFELMGYHPAEVPTMASWWDEQMHPDDRSAVSDQFGVALSTRMPSWNAVYRVRHKDGHYLWVWDNRCIIYDPAGQPVRMIGCTINIDERKRAEEARSLLASIVDSAEEAIIGKTLEGIIVSWNAGAEKIYGYSANDTISRPISILIPPDHVDEMPQILERIRQGERIDRYETIRLRKDGRKIYVSLIVSPIINEQGVVVGASTIAADITERKRMEDALSRNSMRWEILSNVASRLLASDRPQEIVAELCYRVMNFLDCHAFFNYLLDEKKCCLHLNAYAGISADAAKDIEHQDLGAAICGIAAKEGRKIVLENISEIQDPKLDLIKSFGIKAHACYPLVKQGQMIGTLSFGTRSRTSFSDDDLSMIKAMADQVAIAMARIQIEEELRNARDELEIRVEKRTAELSNAKEELESINEELRVEIEEHKNTEKDLIDARDAAESGTRAKAEFLANMSHEIRTPMNSVIGMTGLLIDNENLTPEQKDFIETIRINGDALLTIINDILDFTKIESDKVMLECQTFDLRKCVEEALDLVAVKAAEKGLNIAYTFDKNVPDTIIGDPTRLQQILGNLLSNAVKFTDEGEVNLSVSSKQGDAHEIHFAVQDTGIGIPYDRMGKLFQSFSQMEPSTARIYGGTGLGLAISKKLVEMMGGRIWAESEEGSGSTFHFTILAKAAPGEPKAYLIEVQPQLVGKRVLIADDNKTNRRILGRQTYSWGMLPMIARSGQEALEWIRRGDKFDIAILDMNLPSMDGVALGSEIRKYSSVPLVMLTSIGHRVPSNHAYLIKPIKPSQLYNILLEVFAKQPIMKPAQTQKERAIKMAQNKPLRILLAEDNVSSQKVALQMLKRLGYNADAVANGIEALQTLEHQQYDLIFMDVKMPEMDGLTATKAIRQRWPDNGPKVIAITAYALEGDREKCLEAGMDDYISKPVKMEELAEILSRHQPLPG